MLNQPKARKEAQANQSLQIVWESPSHNVPGTTAQNPNPMLVQQRQFQARNLHDPKRPPPQHRDEYTLPENSLQWNFGVLSLNSNDNLTGRAYQHHADDSQIGPEAC